MTQDRAIATMGNYATYRCNGVISNNLEDPLRHFSTSNSATVVQNRARPMLTMADQQALVL